jgi:N-acetylglucosaminylphosphatidylinositol deacetylase
LKLKYFHRKTIFIKYNLIFRCTELPDNPKVEWPEEIVAESILQHIESHKINAVVTFDKYGVSRHKNHISLFYAIASLCIEKKVPSCKHYITKVLIC